MADPVTISQNRLKYIRKLQQRKYRREYGYYLCEGWRLFETAIAGHANKIGEVVISDEFLASRFSDSLFQSLKIADMPAYQVSTLEMRKLSSEITPQGILFTMPMRTHDKPELNQISDPVMLYLEEISDPGNLGTIIRTALWFDVKIILLSPGSVDPYNPKTVRASAGAIFDMIIHEDVDLNLLHRSGKSSGYRFIATKPHGGIKLNSWHPPEKSVILFGQEASGLSDRAISVADTRLTIAKYGPAESLNLAMSVGIILYHITQHMHK